MIFLIVGIAFTVFFYLVLPCLGGFFVFRRWRQFNKTIIDASYLPIYPAENQSRCRFFGELEAIEEKNIIWLNDGKRRVRVNLKSCPIYILPGENLRNNDKMNVARYTRWQNLSSFSEGTKFFVAGYLDTDARIPAFGEQRDNSLTVVIHDAKPEMFLSRAIGTGRQRNVYWNSITAPSLLLGMFSEFILLLSAIQVNINSNLFQSLATFALLPGLILAPPGIFFFFLYRNYRRRGRRYFMESDLLSLPLRYADNGLPDGGSYSGREVEEMPEQLSQEEVVQLRRAMVARAGEKGWLFSAENSTDPFAERVYINGQPQILAKKSRKQAVLSHCFALLFFAAGLLINVVLVNVVLLLFWFANG